MGPVFDDEIIQIGKLRRAFELNEPIAMQLIDSCQPAVNYSKFGIPGKSYTADDVVKFAENLVNDNPVEIVVDQYDRIIISGLTSMLANDQELRSYFSFVNSENHDRSLLSDFFLKSSFDTFSVMPEDDDLIKARIRECFAMQLCVDRKCATLKLNDSAYYLQNAVDGLSECLYRQILSEGKTDDDCLSFEFLEYIDDPFRKLVQMKCKRNVAKSVLGEDVKHQLRRTREENADCFEIVEECIRYGFDKKKIARVLKKNGAGYAVVGALIHPDAASIDAARDYARRLLGVKKQR